MSTNLLFLPSTYKILFKDDYLRIQIQERNHELYAIACEGMVMNKSFQWEYERQPSSRSDKFIERTRFSLNEAKSLIAKFLEQEKDLKYYLHNRMTKL